jgi:nucleotide-binding universal stress UspA family protein
VANQILVPLDGSALAEQALSCAVMLGQGLSAELVLFRAVSIPSDVQQVLDQADPQADLLETWLEEANRYLRRVANSLQNVGLNVRHVVQHGAAAEAIVDCAGQGDIRQIVMSTHGYTGLKRWRHGSVAERVLQAAGVPVLLVRAGEKEAKDSRRLALCRRILVPLDGSAMSEQVLPIVMPIAQALDAELILFQVSIVYSVEGHSYHTDQIAQDYLAQVAGRLREQEVEASTATGIGVVAESIIKYAEAHHVDLIAMCTHGRTGLARWALGSVADRVLRAAGIPILLVRAS